MLQFLFFAAPSLIRPILSARRRSAKPLTCWRAPRQTATACSALRLVACSFQLLFSVRIGCVHSRARSHFAVSSYRLQQLSSDNATKRTLEEYRALIASQENTIRDLTQASEKLRKQLSEKEGADPEGNMAELMSELEGMGRAYVVAV